ncbi:Glycoprotein endo-alpha-1,2-mannosidase [Gryllus bimaculatus]|nr:Glycoprotein endo-alpha-1,2-mannosidase [Gryllus bimaculatus]
MAVPIRWLIINIKRRGFVSLTLIFVFISVVSIMFYKWTMLGSGVNCLNGHANSPLTTVSQTTFVKMVASYAPDRVSDELIVQHIGNRTEQRLERLKQKVERISRKVKAQTVTLLQKNVNSKNNPNYNVHVFYYPWYGSIAVEGRWRHWNHEYLPNWKKDDKKIYPTGTHMPPTDISSNFYPALGCYSSRDPAIINMHMKEIRDAKIGVVVVSWYPPGMSDAHGDSPDPIIPLLLDVAQRHGLKMALHIEPYRNRNPINFSEHLQYIISNYGNHPALYRMLRRGRELPVFYMYDSYLTPAGAWRELFSSKGNLSIRGTHLDGIFLGLLVEMQHRYDIKKAHFDGFYTYFATNGFTYGSSWKNWRSLSKFAHQNGLIFIPSVGPGYIDTQVRPWNTANTRHRRHGKYYEVAWRSALAAQAKFVSITSFNEWHEGTQIEPSIPRTTSTFTYLDYEPEGPNFYLNLTKWWVDEFIESQKP